MRTAQMGCVILSAAALLCGCASDREKMLAQLGPAADIASASIDNLGWDRDGEPLERVAFTAIVTTWEAGGKSFTDRQHMVVDFEDNELTAAGSTPQGGWTATVDGEGDFDLDAEDGVSADWIADRMRRPMELLLHRLRGPYNLLGGDERARSVRTVRVGGLAAARVGVGGDNRKAIAYYFDPALGLLKYVTAGADRAGGDGTVTVYAYDSFPNGVLFPRELRLVRLGEHVLIGEKPVFEVEVSDVVFDAED